MLWRLNTSTPLILSRPPDSPFLVYLCFSLTSVSLLAWLMLLPSPTSPGLGPIRPGRKRDRRCLIGQPLSVVQRGHLVRRPLYFQTESSRHSAFYQFLSTSQPTVSGPLFDMGPVLILTTLPDFLFTLLVPSISFCVGLLSLPCVPSSARSRIVRAGGESYNCQTRSTHLALPCTS